MSMKSLVGTRMTKKVKFMGQDIEISKLSVAEVTAIQVKAKDIEGDEGEGLSILRTVIRSSVADAADITDDEFNTFPMDELSKVSNEIMKFSGIDGGDKGK